MKPCTRSQRLGAKELELAAFFDTLGDDLEVERVGHRDHGADDRRIVALAGRSVTNERSILIESSGKRRR